MAPRHCTRYATHIPSRLCLTTKCLSCRQEFKKTLTWFNRQKFKCPACGSELDQQPLRDLASVAYLAFRLYWDGNESWEGTDWKDTPKNRARAEAMSVIISDHMENGTFDYLKWFPEGNRADQFRPKTSQPVESTPITINNYYSAWIEKKKPPFVRKSLERDYRQAFSKNTLPFMGDMELNSVTVETLEGFRMHLVEERKLTLKTARNIIDGSLRAMFRMLAEG